MSKVFERQIAHDFNQCGFLSQEVTPASVPNSQPNPKTDTHEIFTDLGLKTKYSKVSPSKADAQEDILLIYQKSENTLDCKHYSRSFSKKKYLNCHMRKKHPKEWEAQVLGL